MEQPLISIIVATYNNVNFLVKECLRSIQNQTYKNLQIIVIGDCCFDSTEEEMKEVCAQDPRVYFENLQTRSYPKELTEHQFKRIAGTPPVNRGLDLAKGDYIAHQDDDEISKEDRIEISLKMIQQKEADFLAAQSKLASGEIFPKGGPGKSIWQLRLPHSTYFYRSNKLGQMRYNMNCYEKSSADRNFLNRLKEKNIKGYFHPEPLVFKKTIKAQERLRDPRFRDAYKNRKA